VDGAAAIAKARGGVDVDRSAVESRHAAKYASGGARVRGAVKYEAFKRTEGSKRAATVRERWLTGPHRSLTVAARCAGIGACDGLSGDGGARRTRDRR
jgi:hypothetical protein